MDDLRDVRAYYERDEERDRLTSGASRVEFERTKEILGRALLPPPAVVADIGGGPGAYAIWLASLGYEVRHRDLMPHHVEHLRRDAEAAGLRLEAEVGDARALDLGGGSVDAVLLLGPLYHLVELEDRLMALREARRICDPAACCSPRRSPDGRSGSTASRHCGCTRSSPRSGRSSTRPSAPA
jgi:2-polyprenyl-3-methyl-5-hydroxy-6-metoxy-1,4-benzoquinol methylase